MVALRDVSNLTDQVCVMSRSALAVCARFTGESSIAEIAASFQVEEKTILEMARSLDEALMLEGETLEAHARSLTTAFDALEALPIRAAADVTPQAMNEAIHAHDMSGDRTRFMTLSGLVAPHLDFERGRLNYAAAYAHLGDPPEDSAPERVIVLGTNHFGFGTGVVMCPIGFETTAGVAQVDGLLRDAMTDRLGDRLIRHRADHAREHSVELQMPWIRHLLGPVPVLGFLVHDPTHCDGASYDGEGVGFDEFLTALRDCLEAQPARTLVVCGADLSHIGRAFGDDFDLEKSRLKQVAEHDQRHLDLLCTGQVDPFLASIRKLENPTRWCTVGGMAALWKLLPGCATTLLRYGQAVDSETGGSCCVSSAAIAFHQSGECSS